MADTDFYIAFSGNAARFEVLARFFNRLATVKATIADDSSTSEELEAVLRDPAWIDLLDTDAIEQLTSVDSWAFEDILGCVLRGEYRLVEVAFDGLAGRLVFDPWAYPFGGTDPLKALVRTFGLEVTRDSFWDGFAEWQQRNAASGASDLPPQKRT